MKYNNIDDYLKNVPRSHFKNKTHKKELKIKILNSIKENRIKRDKTFFDKNIFKLKIALSFGVFFIVIISGIFFYSIVFYYPEAKISLTSLKGKVYIQKNENALKESISEIESIKQNYIIKSEKNSSIKLKIENDTEIIVEEDSVLKVNSLYMKNNKLINIFQLDKGKIECSVNLPSKDSIFEIITPDSSIYIKGTIFSINVNENMDMILNVKKGAVEVEKKLNVAYDRNKIKGIDPEVNDQIKNVLHEKITVLPDSSLTLKHDDIIILSNRINNLLQKIKKNEINPYEIKEKINSIIELNKNINLIKNKITDDVKESKEQSDFIEYKNDIENLLRTKWTLFAENDFSDIITPKNFSTFVLYEGNGNFDIENKKCVFTGNKRSSSGSIFLKKPDDNNIGKYKISVDLNYLYGNDLNLYLGTLMDINRNITGSINLKNLNINDSTEKNIKYIEHNITDFKNINFEVIVDEKFIYTIIIDKQNGKELKSIIEKNTLNIRGEVFIKAKGNGKIIFDNIKVYFGK